jgi:zinc and cadmium transporter
MDALIPYVLAVSAASFIYVAVADLIPGLQQHPSAVRGVQQIVFVALGAATIWLFHH